MSFREQFERAGGKPAEPPERVKCIFIEDECLRNDHTYPGINGWWKNTFSRDFGTDWAAAHDTEIDCGDSFERFIYIDDVLVIMVSAFDGCSAYIPAINDPKVKAFESRYNVADGRITFWHAGGCD